MFVLGSIFISMCFQAPLKVYRDLKITTKKSTFCKLQPSNNAVLGTPQGSGQKKHHLDTANAKIYMNIKNMNYLKLHFFDQIV